MVTKFGGQILATKFGFVPDWLNEESTICYNIFFMTTSSVFRQLLN